MKANREQAIRAAKEQKTTQKAAKKTTADRPTAKAEAALKQKAAKNVAKAAPRTSTSQFRHKELVRKIIARSYFDNLLNSTEKDAERKWLACKVNVGHTFGESRPQDH
ncbi:hypothetical protein WA026_007685 [Henosepilachna vigintioctopunctata]|uniref:Uncharacterized protein n=1 Tax=Henosepilachna vigintioctopunctata TaxID=420089 RepID=A0AAW1TYF1_9CUCU